MPGTLPTRAGGSRAGVIVAAACASLAVHALAGVVAWSMLGGAMLGGGRDPSIPDALVTLRLADVPAPRPGETNPAPSAEAPARASTSAESEAMGATAGLSAGAVAKHENAVGEPREAPSLSNASARGLGDALGSGAAGVTFAGLSASGVRARSVVYVVDASGPMVTTLPGVLAEVRRSVDALLPTQRFGVVLFSDALPGSAAVFDSALRDASPRQRSRLDSWLRSVAPAGKSSPLAGLRAGLALRPQVIFLLSRSIERSGGGQWGEGLQATLDELERLNPVDPATGLRPVLIKTVQFLEPDPTGTMQAIAQYHGGGARGGEGGPSAVVVKELKAP